MHLLICKENPQKECKVMLFVIYSWWYTADFHQNFHVHANACKGLLESLLAEKKVVNQDVPVRQSFSKDGSSITYKCGFPG